MITNYIKIAIRNIFRKPLSSFINILGLTTGLISSLLILKYCFFELSYDRFHPNADRLFRVATVNFNNDVMVYKDAMSFNLTGPTMKEELSEVEEFARAFDYSSGLNMRVGTDLYRETEAIIADPSFLELFNYPLVQGNPETALENPFSIILTESTAGKYFGNEDPLGKTIEVVEGQLSGVYNVTGLIRDVPENTHLKFDMIISYETFWSVGVERNWNNFIDYTYVRLTPGTDYKILQKKLFSLSKKHMGDESTLVFYLQPVVDIHLHSNFAYEPEAHGDANVVYFLIFVALSLIIIAWVNYINLSTARAFDRAKEVGIRKTIGAQKSGLITQFLIESFVINLLATILALAAIYQLLPFFENLIGKDITGFWEDQFFWFTVGILFITGIILSGIYPAFIQSSFKPVSVLKGRLQGSTRGILLRKILVIFQFTTTAFFITGTIVVYKQINYLLSQDLGMNLDKVLIMRAPPFNFPGFLEQDSSSVMDFERFRNQVVKLPSVQDVTTSTSIPAGGSANIGSMSGGTWWEQNINENRLTYYNSEIDESFIEVYGIDLIAGTNFYPEMPQDTIHPVLLNMTALKSLGFENPEQSLNEYLVIGSNHRRIFRVVGVVDNFYRQSLKHPIEPTIYLYNRHSNGMYYSLKLNTNNLKQALSSIEDAWRQVFPNLEADYFFADQQFEAQYQTDKQLGKIFTLFSILAIIIACLGLFGLAHFVVEYRTKEIGIRKVLGASVNGILKLLTWDFLKLILISILIGIPFILWAMNSWLQNYSRQISISWWMILAGSALVLFIVIITVSIHTIKAAKLNPSHTLRHE